MLRKHHAPRSSAPTSPHAPVRRLRIASAGLLVLLLVAAPAAAKTDPAVVCKAKIIDGAAKLLRQVANATQKCRDAVLSGDLPPGTNCTTEPKTAALITGYENALARTIARNCGGDDNACASPDDIPLADIGWNIGTCRNIAGASCGRTIASCADVSTCLACLARGGVAQFAGLAYDQLSPTTPDAKAVRKCQATLGKAAVKLVSAQSSSLATCWRSVNVGKATAPCPDPGDGKAAAKIASAAAKLEQAVCKACGGPDKACGGGDDLSRSMIGFPSTCPSFGGCARSINSLSDLVACLGCVTAAGVTCPDRAAVPGVATAAPDFSVNYVKGAFPTLRFYFVAAGDSTMIVNDPSGVFRCNDDSFGTLNPTIDYSSPSSGRYDIWVGSFSSGSFPSGTLYVTESTGNHP